MLMRPECVQLALIELNGALGLSRPTSPATHRVASMPTDSVGVEEEDTIPATEDAHVAKGRATSNVKLPKLSLKRFGGDLESGQHSGTYSSPPYTTIHHLSPVDSSII